MEPQHIALGISAGNFVLTWGVALYMYLANKNKATNERIGDMERDIDDKFDAHAARIGSMESRLAASPTHEDLKHVHEKLNRVAEDTSRMSGELKGVNDTLRLILARITDRGLQ